jgi:hypothetical protein
MHAIPLDDIPLDDIPLDDHRRSADRPTEARESSSIGRMQGAPTRRRYGAHWVC